MALATKVFSLIMQIISDTTWMQYLITRNKYKLNLQSILDTVKTEPGDGMVQWAYRSVFAKADFV
jgi:hypothetical protein